MNGDDRRDRVVGLCRWIGPLVTVLWCVACGGGDESSSLADSDATPLNHAPRFASDGAWSVDSHPVLEIGGNSVQLFRVVSARFLNTGGVVVGNAGSSEVVLFEADGSEAWRFGGQGEGPGKFGEIASTALCSDSVLAVSEESRRLTLVSATGELLGIRDLKPSSGARSGVFVGFEGISEDCRRALIMTANPEGSGGAEGRPFRFEYDLWWYDLATEVMTLVTTVPGPEMFDYAADGNSYVVPLPFGAQPSFASGRGWFAVADGSRYEVHRFSDDGPAEVVRWSRGRREISPEEKRSYGRGRQAWLDAGGIPAAFPPLSALPVSRVVPAIGRLVLGEDGELWAKSFPTRSSGRDWAGEANSDRNGTHWSVIDSHGIWLSELTLPARFTLMDVSGDRLLGVWRDEFDVEHIRIYKLLRR